MKKVLITLFAAVFIVSWIGCSPKKVEEKPEVNVPESFGHNQLSEQQVAEGWQLLFDGQTTIGWQIFKGRKNNTWEVVDGTLHCKALNETTGDGNERSDLITTAEFENFELAFDWKIGVQGNSGIMFRVTEDFEQPYYSGPEYQLMDDSGFPDETPDHLTGSNYGMHAAANTKIKPAGEWNTSKLVVNKNQVEHWLNGEKVVAYELNSPDWLALKKASKWNEAPGYGASPKGHIAFQDHGSEAWFRNIKIKTL
jgi:Domain of Unknown Function (DUF1080)